ncbi:Glucosaminyl phosphatidylinositol (GlcN-PI) nositol acylation protein [Rhizoclosmatium sp. JEL0117]|nr:Glucosaminyl phosphatidylinositol (GlcN-PI) nositol acylation protein [Rhizoclosmatium sp. JEL0117]
MTANTPSESVSSSRKAAKEAFVTGLSGGTVWEPQMLMLLCVVCYVLFRGLGPRLLVGARPSVRAAIEGVVLVGPPLFAVSLLSDSSAAASLLLFVAALALVVAATPLKSLRVALSLFANSSPSLPKLKRHRPFTVVFRAVLQLLTVVAILAVDFNVFPRRFAKTESFGYSLMDLGVGGFIFSNGFVAGPRLKQLGATSQKRWANVVKSAAISFPILVLGFARFILTKGVDYQEHVTEYGVHWNFFITLGLIPILTALLQYVIPNIHFGLAGGFIMAGYEYVLSKKGLQDFILNAPREGSIFHMNREGICSFLGYWAIFFIAAYMGDRILTTPEQLSIKEAPIMASYKKKGTKPEQPKQEGFSVDLLNIIDLVGFLSALTTLFVCLRYEAKILVSRRMANSSYCLWVICVSLSLILGTLLVDYLYTQFLTPSETDIATVLQNDKDLAIALYTLHNPSTTVSTKKSRSQSRNRSKSRRRGTSVSKLQEVQQREEAEAKMEEWKREFAAAYLHRVRTPYVFDCVNRNQLAVFLVANVLTGLTNLSIDTLYVSDVNAVWILVGYLSAVIGMAVWWNEMDWTLNMNAVGSGLFKQSSRGRQGNNKKAN